MADGQWVGLQHKGMAGGSFPGCYPTRAQVGAGALIIDGFDFIESSVNGRQGQRWFIIYGAVSAPQTLARVRDTFSGINASLVSGHYFAIALHPIHNDYGDDVHLEAFDAAGQQIATQGKRRCKNGKVPAGTIPFPTGTSDRLIGARAAPAAVHGVRLRRLLGCLASCPCLLVAVGATRLLVRQQPRSRVATGPRS
jgi:hypothetical protein